MPLVAVVVDRAGRRDAAGDAAHRGAEPDERREQLVAVGRRAAGDDPRRDAAAAAAHGRRGTARRRSPVGGRGGSRGRGSRGARSRACEYRPALHQRAGSTAPATNAAAKLGIDAPPQGRACGCSVRDEPRPPAWADRIQPLVEREAGEPRDAPSRAAPRARRRCRPARSGAPQAASRRAARRTAARRMSRAGTGTAGSCAGRSRARRSSRRLQFPRRGALRHAGHEVLQADRAGVDVRKRLVALVHGQREQREDTRRPARRDRGEQRRRVADVPRHGDHRTQAEERDRRDEVAEPGPPEPRRARARDARTACISLIATRSPSVRWRAATTSPMAPRPRTFSTRYLPRRTSPEPIECSSGIDMGAVGEGGEAAPNLPRASACAISSRQDTAEIRTSTRREPLFPGPASPRLGRPRRGLRRGPPGGRRGARGRWIRR